MNRPALPVGVLASGEGTNLQALLDSVHGHEARIVAVATDVPSARAIGRASDAGVPVGVFPLDAFDDREAHDAAMADWLEAHGVRLVVLAGYMTLLTPVFLARFPGAVLNVHPALLPAFPGVDGIEQAVEYGVKVFGVTVHLVDEGMDTGPIVLQRAVELRDVTDPDEVRRQLRPIEHALVPEAVRLFARGAIREDPANPRRTVVDRS
jgi:phosphoribosylglycinamide formyltransferase-1